MGIDFRRMKDVNKASEFVYDTIIEAFTEVEIELANDEEYEKAALIRDEIAKLKDERNAIHTVR